MRAERLCAWIVVAAGMLCALLSARPAQAWTETRVETAGAHVELLEGGHARVRLRVGVNVQGGWLSRLDLAGLDPALALDPAHAPFMQGEDGERRTPELKIKRDGRVLISFPSRTRAPRRGRHSLELAYFTRLASEAGRGGERTLRWALPVFLADLRDVDVSVDAPAGAQPIATDDGATRTTHSARGERVLLRWQRAQLPRTASFEVALRMPASGAPAHAPPAASLQPVRAPALGGTSALATLALLLLAWAKRAAVGSTCRRERARAVPLLGLTGLPRALGAVALAGAASWLHPTHPLLGAALLGGVSACALDRALYPAPAAQPRWTRARLVLELARLRQTRARRLFGGSAWLDATTPLGLGALASAYALVLLRAQLGAGLDVWLEALLAATPLWLSATRLRLPPTAVERFYAQHAQQTAVATAPPDDAKAIDRAAA